MSGNGQLLRYVLSRQNYFINIINNKYEIKKGIVIGIHCKIIIQNELPFLVFLAVCQNLLSAFLFIYLSIYSTGLVTRLRLMQD